MNTLLAVLQQSAQQVGTGARRLFVRSAEMLQYQQKTLQSGSTNFQKLKRSELKNLEININNMDPVNVLKRGFTITLHNGKAITSVKGIKPGDVLETIAADGKVTGNVQSIENKPGNE